LAVTQSTSTWGQEQGGEVITGSGAAQLGTARVLVARVLVV
jgi:hypothetical protein